MAGFLTEIRDTGRERVSSYTRELLARAEEQHGRDSSSYRGIYNQYFNLPDKTNGPAAQPRHFQAEGGSNFPKGVERYYKRVVVIELLSACASECVFCVRGLYDRFALTNADIDEVVTYLASEPDLQEILVTGGDPMTAASKLGTLIRKVRENARNIRIVRIGTRLPVQDPARLNSKIYDVIEEVRGDILVEIACQINSHFELQPEAVAVIRELQSRGARLYSQNVLLKGVNDTFEDMLKLYDELRQLHLIPYYLYHAVPLAGTDKYRTTVQKGLDIIKQLTSSGHISGLAKPFYTLMTELGKVTLYEGCIQDRSDGRLLIKTSYRDEDRLIWNPYYTRPASAVENSDGTLSVWYVDGHD